MENSILRTYTWDVVSILVVSFYVCFFFVNTTLVEIKAIQHKKAKRSQIMI